MPVTSVSFGPRDAAGDTPLSPAEKPPRLDLDRRDFLVRFCQGAGATFIPSCLWGWSFPLSQAENSASPEVSPFHLHPHYRNERPLDATLLKVRPELDRFPNEQYAEEIAAILAEWSKGLRDSPVSVQSVRNSFSTSFQGASVQPTASKLVRNAPGLEVTHKIFSIETTLGQDAFLLMWQSAFRTFSRIETAEFQITKIDFSPTNDAAEIPKQLETSIRYEIVGTGPDFHREQRIGTWQLRWESKADRFFVSRWRAFDETRARALRPIYADITAAVLGGNPSYSAQMLHGIDYWRTVLDGACGIDVYGHNGVSVADIDNDGFDDLYICQTAGLPNRLYRNRGDGTFEDITESSGLGILENTVCALFADFDNDGYQDVILVRANGPLLFLNDGKGRFRERPDAFQFANPPEGTFTGAAVADYDRDGCLDIYFCVYSYYQGTGQYKYPSPYHDAKNGPPNFMMRNNRDGSFRDVTAESGLNRNNTRYSFCCGWVDFNGDGWPDLYVVNDFGRKNLYRNNGDGTFTDIAAEQGVEDVGAGMSVSWLDYDRDGAADLYVANMWTAAGVRVSMQDSFKKDSSPEVRALYQKHAMGNSLLRNRDPRFEDVTASAGVGVGRWAWSSDAFDFDHDGYPDLYVANGMVSGPSGPDLNSFFWRQVVAYSPDTAISQHDYEQGWNAINELIRADGSWSGYERNVFFANNRDGTFSDVSGAVGLDFSEDGRSFALADFDHDGRLEIVLKNRNAPQLRVLKNVVENLPPSISFRLQGTRSNRDAIGASVTIETSTGRQTQTVQAGSAFLSQHSKEVFFGLGEGKGTVRASIRWPSGLVQELHDLPVNHRIWIEEGSPPKRIEPFNASAKKNDSHQLSSQGEVFPPSIEIWLLAPVPAPDFSLPDLSGQTWTLSGCRGKPVLLSFRSSGHADEGSAKTHAEDVEKWAALGLQTITMIVEDPTHPERSSPNSSHSGHPVIRASDDVAAIYNILYRQLFDRHRDLTLPTSFLIDREGHIVKVYQGPLVPEHVEHDFTHIPASDAERLAVALPFPSSKYPLEFGRNQLSLGALFFQRGYLDPAGTAFQQALRDDPASAEALYGIGSVYLNQNKNAAAREMFERCVKLQATYPDTLPDAWNNLGVLATRENRLADAAEDFQQALKLNPHHLLSLNNLGNAYRAEKRWTDAREILQRAIEISPDDAEANYSLGMVYAQTEENAKAEDHLKRALKSRPAYPEALNNLGVLYLVTRRRDEAVASFEQSIRVAPAFDQAYLNLARVYALEDSREKAKGVLLELLKQHPDHPQAKQMLDRLQQ